MSRDRSFFSPTNTSPTTSTAAKGLHNHGHHGAMMAGSANDAYIKAHHHLHNHHHARDDSHAVDMRPSPGGGGGGGGGGSANYPPYEDARMGAKSSLLGSAANPASSTARSSGAPPSRAAAMAPILAYCASSILMTVVNKFVLSGKHFSMNLVVLVIQSVVGVVLVLLAQRMRMIQLREWNSRDAWNWAPISFALVMVIWTGSKALQYLSIPVYTIFKNLTIILIAYGEVIWFNGRITRLTMLSFLLMVLSSVIAAWSDISRLSVLSGISIPHAPDFLDAITHDPKTGAEVKAYDPMRDERQRLEALAGSGGGGGGGDGYDANPLSALNSGYVWMALNCACSAAYVLSMRKRIKLTGFKDWDTMYFNNLLSIPCLVVMSLLVEDWSRASLETNFPPETRNRLLSAIVFSGACAVFISYTTAWCIRVTSSTTYSMVGALNKLPIALSGALFQPLDAGTQGGITVGFLSGIVYAYAKNRQAQAQSQAKATALANGGHGTETSALGGAGGGGGVGAGFDGGASASKGGVNAADGGLGGGGVIPMHHLNGSATAAAAAAAAAASGGNGVGTAAGGSLASPNGGGGLGAMGTTNATSKEPRWDANKERSD